MKKKLLFLAGFMFFVFGVFAQNYSGKYSKMSDTELDGIANPSFTGTFQLSKVNETHYTGKLDGSDQQNSAINIIIYKVKGKILFTATQSGNGYMAVISGIIEGNTFKGAFFDNNGAKGDISWTKETIKEGE